MYDINSLLIAGILLVSMVGAIEIGFHVGFGRAPLASESSRAHINAVLASLLGILALLLGFTFSLALQRYDGRSASVVAEANAIGTTYLRALLLPPSVREAARQGLRDYVDLRIRGSQTNLAHEDARRVLVDDAARLQNELWSMAARAAREEPNPVTTGLFVQSLNDMIDALSRRDAALGHHVPEIVLLLLYATFLMAALILGYTSGVSGHRASFVSYVLVALIVCLVFIIVDLDRPRRGIIQVSQQSLIELRAAMADRPAAAIHDAPP